MRDDPQGGGSEPESIADEARGLMADFPGLVTDRIRLFSLELERAASVLGRMAALGALAAVLAATAWIALWAGIAAALIAVGLAWCWAALLVFVVNTAGGAWCALRVKSLAPLLTMPATLRRLTEWPEPRGREPSTPSDGP